MSTTQELVERLQNVSEWKQIVERHRRITDDPAISYVLQDGTRVHEDENVIAKLAASFFRALEGAADTASAAAERLDELERENARMREALKPFASEGALWHDSTTTPTEDEPLWISSYETRRSPDEAKFTLGDLRRARAALAGSEKP